jgi:hypothetical protein
MINLCHKEGRITMIRLFQRFQPLLLMSAWLGLSAGQPGTALANHTGQSVRVSPLLSLNFEPPDRGAPGESRDAGSRPLCEPPDKPFTAIAPAQNWGETTSQNPTFWLYIPYEAGDVDLYLRDEQTQEEVFRHTFEVTGGAGIHGFTLPASAPELEADKLYAWQLDFVCNPETGTKFRTTGMITRRPLAYDLEAALAEANPQEQAALYAEAGLWYDALEIVADLHQQYPDDQSIADDWASLLEHPSVGLDDLVNVPIVQ